jgi:FAD:protein FMN transferase
VTPAGHEARRRVHVERIWGTAVTIDLRDPAELDVVDRVVAWFRRVDELFSTWRPDSEISRLGRGELSLREVSPEVREVLALCDQLQDDSTGAFDARVGADPRVAPRDGLGPIDPSGVVKGWALEGAAALVRRTGGRNFAINAGGDVLTAGVPADGELWRVGIQHPWRRDNVAMVLAVSDLGVATSGRYERGDHIIDPRTGTPATGLMSVSVVHADLAVADGYATAALVLGKRGPAWLAERGVAAAAIADDGTVTVTPELSAHRVS